MLISENQRQIVEKLDNQKSTSVFQFALVLLLIFSTLGGQLLRVPYLQGTGILAGDLILGIIGIFWLMRLITGQSKIAFKKTNFLLLLFLFFTLVSLLFNLYLMPSSDALLSLFYYLRLCAYLALFFVAQDFTARQATIFQFTILTACALTLLGFLQLKFFPNFEILKMQEKGWDPHIGRMLSTWFDPNFLGGFFAFILSLIIGVLVVRLNQAKNFLVWLKTKENLVFSGAVCLLLAGLALTYSRSSYLAFLIAMFILAILASRRLLVIGIISVILVFSFSDRIQKRVIDAYQSAQSILNSQSVDTPDATARFRIESWREGINLYQEKPLLGHGFNTLRYVQAKRGLTEWKSHNAGGIDASLLTLLVTTGAIGLILFLAFIFQLLKNAFQNYRHNPDPLIQGLSLGYFCGMLGLFAHSFFVNSLLFPFLMIFMWIFGGMLEKATSYEL